MFPRATAKRKVCKIGRQCGLGCVPKNHNCKVALRGQAKTAAEWLARVSANPNYEDEANAKLDKRLTRLNKRVNSYYKNRTKKKINESIKENTNNPDSSELKHTITYWENDEPIELTYNQLVGRLGKKQADQYLQKTYKAFYDRQTKAIKSFAQEKAKEHPYSRQKGDREAPSPTYPEYINAGKEFIPSDLREAIEPVIDVTKKLRTSYLKALEKERKTFMDNLKELSLENLGKEEREARVYQLQVEVQKEAASIGFALNKGLQTVEKLTQFVRDQLIEESEISKEESKKMAEKITFAASLNKPRNGRKHNQSKIREDIAEFFQLTGGMGSKSFTDLVMTSDRSHAKIDGTVNIGEPRSEQKTKEALFHEIGHHIEFESKKVHEAAREWVLSRASSDKPISLNELTKGSFFDDNEIAYPDEFVSPYVGKEQWFSTEVVSMGLERFSTAFDMADLLVSDPEHFYFVLGVLRTKNV